VTVVVAIYAPELLPELGEFWTPVAAAVVGNIAGQVVANVIGIQNGFDWKSVAVAAVTAGITQGLTSEGTLPPATSTAPADVALRAAVGTAVNQGARIVVGLQEDFSWRAVAASYVGAYAGAEVSNAIGEGQYGVSAEDWAKMNADKAQYAQLMGDFSNNFTRQFASGVVNSVVTTAVSGGKLDLAHLAGDAFGNAFGSAWGSYLVYGSQQQTTLQQTQQNAAPLTAADVEDTELGAAMRSYGLTFVPGAIPFETFAEGSASAPLYDPWAPREMQGSVGTGPLPPELGGNPLESLQTLELRPGDTVAMKNFASGMADNFAITASNSTISDDQLNGILNAAQQNADRVAQGQRSDLLYADASGMLGTRTAGPAVEDIGGGPTNAGRANSNDLGLTESIGYANGLAFQADMAQRRAEDPFAGLAAAALGPGQAQTDSKAVQERLDYINEQVREGRGQVSRAALYLELAKDIGQYDKEGQRAVLSAINSYAESRYNGSDIFTGRDSETRMADAAVRYAADQARQSGVLPEGGRLPAEYRQGADLGLMLMLGGAARRAAAEAEGAGTYQATLGRATSTNYRATFFEANPELEGQVVVHHAVEQQVLERYPGVVTEAEIHSLENLRGVPKDINAEVHLSEIRREWNQFYRENPTVTKEMLLQKATQIDLKYSNRFNPPIRNH